MRLLHSLFDGSGFCFRAHGDAFRTDERDIRNPEETEESSQIGFLVIEGCDGASGAEDAAAGRGDNQLLSPMRP